MTSKRIRRKDKELAYKVTMWRICVTILTLEKQQCILCAYLMSYLKLSTAQKKLSVEQQCFNNKFTPPVTMQIIRTGYLLTYSMLQSPS